MKLIFVLCSALLVFGTLSVAGVACAQNETVQPWATDSTPPFDDVPADHWASQATHKLRDVGIVIGYPNGTFDNSRVASGPFGGVPADHWAYLAVDTLQKAGIVIGYPDGTYGGRPWMTRLDFAVAVARLLPVIDSDSPDNPDSAAIWKEMRTNLTQSPDALEALRWLVIEFRPELTKLGVSQHVRLDVSKALTTLNDLLKPPADGLKQ